MGIVAVTSLLDPVEHLALHAVLHFAATQHQVEHLVDGTLRVFLPTQDTHTTVTARLQENKQDNEMIKLDKLRQASCMNG